MGKRNLGDRQANHGSGATVAGRLVQTRTRMRTLQMVTAIAALGIVLSVLMRHSPAGGSNDPAQVGVMVWPDDVPVPKVPPTTEFDASMKTQAAGIFINPKLNIKHLIRFRDGATIAERDF